jgi:hypothetical protein
MGQEHGRKVEDARRAIARAQVDLAEAEKALERLLNGQRMPSEPSGNSMFRITVKRALGEGPRTLSIFRDGYSLWRTYGGGISRLAPWDQTIAYLDTCYEMVSDLEHYVPTGPLPVNGEPFRIGARIKD